MSENQAPKQQKKKINIGGVIGIVVMLLIGFAGGFFGAEAIDHLGGGDGEKFFINLFVTLAGLYIAFFLQIILHEGGHLVFGLLTGYQFVSFNVCGFIWQKGPDGKLHAGRMQLAGAGGQCLMAPPEYNGGDFPFALYNLGGVRTNLLTAAIFGLLAWAIPVTWLRIRRIIDERPAHSRGGHPERRQEPAVHPQGRACPLGFLGADVHRCRDGAGDPPQEHAR